MAPGNLPDGVDILSGLPETIPGNVVEPPRVHEDQPGNGDGSVTRLSDGVDEAKCWVAGAVRAGGTGEWGFGLPLNTTFAGRGSKILIHCSFYNFLKSDLRIETSSPNVRQPNGGKIMADDKEKTGKPDRDRINVHEPYELSYWSKELGVTPDKLKETVKDVGPMVTDVKRKLGK